MHNVNVNMNVPNPPPGPGGPIPNAHLSSPPPIVGVPPPAGAPIPVPVPGAPGGSAGSTPGVGQPGYDDPNGAPAPAAGGYVYYTHYPYPSVSHLISRLTSRSFVHLFLILVDDPGCSTTAWLYASSVHSSDALCS